MRSGLLGKFYFSGHVTCGVGVSRGEGWICFQPFPGQCLQRYPWYMMLIETHIGPFFWNFLVVGLIMGGSVGGSEGAQ